LITAITFMTVYPLSSPPLSNRAGNRQTWGQLHGSAQALAIANAALAHSGLSLVIAADTSSALRLESELQFFCAANNTLQILHLPDWETLPYDSISPHQDIISERLSTLYRLPSAKHAVLVVPITTLLQRLMPQSYLLGN